MRLERDKQDESLIESEWYLLDNHEIEPASIYTFFFLTWKEE